MTLAENQYSAFAAKWNRRLTSTPVTSSMIAAAIDETILATAIHESLHMNSLYARVP